MTMSYVYLIDVDKRMRVASPQVKSIVYRRDYCQACHLMGLAISEKGERYLKHFALLSRLMWFDYTRKLVIENDRLMSI